MSDTSTAPAADTAVSQPRGEPPEPWMKDIKICVEMPRPGGSVSGLPPNPPSEPEESISSPRHAGDHLPRMGILRGNAWGAGHTLTISFGPTTPRVLAMVQKYCLIWTQFANIYMLFVGGAASPNANIRVSFVPGGSWSYVGTDSLLIPAGQPTMNFGWFDDQTSETEFSRVTLHEFGHALGCIHEHQHPYSPIQWNYEYVYQWYSYYMGWTREEVDNWIFRRYSATVTQFSQFDPYSIMMYAIPPGFTTNGFTVEGNNVLSYIDTKFIAEVYPR